MFAIGILNKHDRYHAVCFYATLCHWCKKRKTNANQTQLKRCGGCEMIAYCSHEHQKKHWPEHKYICKAIQRVRQKYATELSACQDARAAMKLLREKVTLKLKRDLKRYEVQMFKYPRMCWLCRKQNSTLLKDCQNCMASFCSIHKNDHDESTCSTLLLTLKSDLLLYLHSYEPERVKYVKYMSHEDVLKFDNMRSFLKTYKDIILTYALAASTPHDMMECAQSMLFTRSLTVLHGLQVLDCIPQHKKSVVIHVILADEADPLTLPSWETIFHFIPTIQFLKVVMITPENLHFLRFNLGVCPKCKRLNKDLFIEWSNDHYKQYVQKSQDLSRPDLVVGFHAGFYEYDDESNEQKSKEAWMSSVQVIAKQNCPLLLTFYSETEAKLNIDKINFVLEKDVDYFYCGMNPFASLRPSRWYADNPQCPVFYENSYMLLYRSLYA